MYIPIEFFPRACAVAVASACAFVSAGARAQTDVPGELAAARARLAALERSLAEQEARLQADRAALATERQRLDAMLSSLRGRGGEPARTVPVEVAQAQNAPAQQPSPQPAATPDKPVGEAPKAEAPRYAQIFETPGVLTGRGKLTVEPALQYVRATDNRIALVGFTVIPAITIGLIDVRRVARDTYYEILTTRYGVTSRFELEAKLPYVQARSSTLTRPLATPSTTDTYFDAKGSGIGDVELGMRYQLNEVAPERPVYVGSLRLKTRTGTNPFEVPVDPNTGLQTELATGTGFYGIQPGITALIPSDPAVFFGGISYMHSVGRDVGNGYGRVQPGHVIDVSLGMGLALNERASFSIGYQHSIVGKTSQKDNDPTKTLAPGPTLQLGTLRFGTSFRYDARTTVNFTIGIGVTKDSPDLELTLRLPFTI